jgi:antagonist of KipI
LIVVESAGLQTTVQDLGRPGFGPMGVSRSGAADPVALVIANRLVGNPPNTAALEMTLIGGRYRFESHACVAVAGASCPAKLDGVPVELWATLNVPAGAILEIGPAPAGARMYLSVSGGIQVPTFLGSASTHLLTGLGGFEGRALRKGDRLAFGTPPEWPRRRRLRRETLARLSPRRTIRVTYGPQAAWFTDGQRADFVSNPYRVTQEANRMGLRLEGTPIPCPDSSHMVTEGVALGAIQMPADGQPIILFVEQQTTGGYPKIANVIAADIASCGQLRPGDEVRFEWVSIETARSLIREQARLLSQEELFIG